MDQRFLSVLTLLLEKCTAMDEQWVVAGSMSLALQGVNVSPSDIDVVTTKDGAFKINDLLKQWEAKSVEFGCTEQYKSYYGKFKIQDISIDVMGALKEKRNGKWISLSSRLSSPKIVTIAGRDLPVTPLKHQLESYKMSEREKDKVIIQKIEQTLELEPE